MQTIQMAEAMIEDVVEAMKKWWGHLNNKRSIQGGTTSLQHKEKCKA